jgi:ubiquinol-cytochrome c reductase cytochrome b subunit
MAAEKEVDTTGLLGWIDRRFPLTSTWKAHLSEYYAPKNFNFWYFFGSLALLVLVLQIVTGIFLVMNYKPDATLAFASVEYIMRDVPWGWLIRYLHSTGASMFFVVVYLHMFRGLLYGSYRKPRELVWVFGCLIFLCLMAEAFFGYLLPWGQMSYWGAQVIVNLFSAIPFIGPDLSLWIRGDYVVSDVTLNRFFAFHVIAIPLVLLALVVAHIIALHEVGSNNPDGIEIKQNKDINGRPIDGIPFHPYYSVHDFMGVSVFLFIFCAIVFFAPEMGGYFLEANNFIPADSLKTPSEIAPVWYFTAFYAMLRAITDYFKIVLEVIAGLLAVLGLIKARTMKWKIGSVVIAAVVIAVMLTTQAKFWGVLVMGGAVVTLFFLPWLDHSPVKSIRYRPMFHKVFYGIFVIVFLTLAFLGTKPPTPAGTLIAQIGTLLYFGFFWGMPFWTRLGTFKPVPDRVTFKPH